MKKLLIGVAFVVGLVIAAAIIVPFFVPVETYKDQIASRVKDATGRDLAIAGEVSFSLLPSLALEVNDVSFSNAPGGEAEDMAKLSQLVVKLKLFPLLGGEVQIDSFVLVDAAIHLEVDKEGRPNWLFAGAKAGRPAAAAPEKKAAAKRAGAPGVAEIRLGDVRLVNGTVTYADARTGQRMEVSEINMRVSLPDLDSPLEATGYLVWNGEKIELGVGVEAPRQLVEGGTTAVAFTLESAPIALDYKGSLSTGAPLAAAGEVDLTIPSVRSLAAWAGKPLALEGSGLGPLSLTGKVGVEGKQYSFTQAKLALDSMKADGEVTVNLAGARPYLKARLDVDRLDLNPYLPPEGKPGGEAGKAAEAPAPADASAAPTDWSDEPIDLGGLRAADADLALSVGAILVQELKVGRSALTVSLKKGKLVADLTELSLYGGSGKGQIAIDGSGEIPAVTKKFTLSGVEAEPMLRDASGFDRLTGTASADISVSTRGRSERDMVKALEGGGAIKFTDGAIRGINLAAMVRNVKTAFLESGAGEAQKTDFAELSGTFKIKNGILSNDDLKLLNPLLRLNGAGSVDLPKRTVNYRLEPKLVASTEGQGGDTEAAGLTVPVIIEGPWHDLSYKPDLAAMVGGALKDPSKALEGAKGAVEGLTKGATGGVGDLLKGVTSPAAPAPAPAPAPSSSPPPGGAAEEKSLLPDPGKALKGLFGN